MVDNQFLVDAGVGHGNHIVDGCRPVGKLSAKPLLDGSHVGGVSCLNVIESRANGGTGNRAKGPANCRTCPGAAKLISDNSPRSGPNQPSEKGPLVRMIRRLTPGTQDHRHHGPNCVLPAETPHTLLSTLIRRALGRPKKELRIIGMNSIAVKTGWRGWAIWAESFPAVSAVSRLPASQVRPIFPRPCIGSHVRVACCQWDLRPLAAVTREKDQGPLAARSVPFLRCRTAKEPAFGARSPGETTENRKAATAQEANVAVSFCHIAHNP